MRIPALKLITLVAPESSDADLLVRFATGRDEAAFEELVRRHGPAVLRVCRRLVGLSAADDAFQAVFLVLACRAKAVRKAASVGSWLIGVAGRVARQMRKQLRRKRQASLGCQDDLADPAQPSPGSHLHIPELAAALEEELTRLPDALRAPIVLCLVEGRTLEQATTELGGSLRTLRRRLDRAKALLRLRLERRGVVPAVIAALIGSMQTSSAVPPELVRRTVHGVFDFLAGGLGDRAAPAAIAKGVVAGMATFKTSILAPVVACVLVGLGALWAQDGPRKSQPEPQLPLPGTVLDDGTSKTAQPTTKQSQELPTLQAPWVIEITKTAVTRVVEETYRSKNFIVQAPTATMARAIAAEAEYQRVELAKLWLGKELPTWDKPCEIRYGPWGLTTGTSVGLTPAGTSGVSTFSFGTRNDGSPTMLTSLIALNGEFLGVLTDELPRNVMHVVMASYFGKALSRWADEGLAVATESTQFQARHDELCRELLNAGRGIRLRHLLPMMQYPKDLKVLHSQGHSVAVFLIAQKVTGGVPILKDNPQLGKLFWNVANGNQQFIVFLLLGMEKNTIESWDKAAKTVYGFENVDALEKAWLEYLKKPESRITSPEQQPNTPKPKNPDFIPPTAIPTAKPWAW